jgi:hypothetical protein
MKRLIALSALFAALVLAGGCEGDEKEKIAKSLAIASKAMYSLQETVIEAHKQGMVSDETVKEILLTCIDVNQAGRAAAQYLKVVEEVTPEVKQRVFIILAPAVASVSRAMTKVDAIEDLLTRAHLKTFLITAGAALSGVSSALQ